MVWRSGKNKSEEMRHTWVGMLALFLAVGEFLCATLCSTLRWENKTPTHLGHDED